MGVGPNLNAREVYHLRSHCQQLLEKFVGVPNCETAIGACAPLELLGMAAVALGSLTSCVIVLSAFSKASVSFVAPLPTMLSGQRGAHNAFCARAASC